MGHAAIMRKSAQAQEAEVGRLVDIISSFEDAVLHGSRVVICEDFYIADKDIYEVAYLRFAALVTRLRGEGIDLYPVFYELENGDDFDEMHLEVPSHVDDYPHGIHIYNRYNPF